VVRVADRFDNPVAGVTVIFEPGAGSVSDSIAATDSAGRATIRWTLGAAVGAQKLVARVADVGKPAEVLATATVGKVAKAAFGAPPAGPSVSRALAPQPAVTITDAMGNPIAGATVVFATTTGTVSPATVKTDAKGRAATKWTLGAKAGVQRLSATVRGTTIKATLEVKAAAPAATAATRKKPGHP
jgi:hypothetical protein